jgi:hypothetical protein
MRCRTCGYDLHELRDPRCPECGRGFDPADPRTFLSRPFPARRRLVQALLALLLLSLPPFFAWLVDNGFASESSWASMWVVAGPLMMLVGFVLSFQVCRTTMSAVHGEHAWIEHRRSLWAAMLISSALLAGCVVALLVPIAMRMLG